VTRKGWTRYWWLKKAGSRLPIVAALSRRQHGEHKCTQKLTSSNENVFMPNMSSPEGTVEGV
jgi:hypothetical protein